MVYVNSASGLYCISAGPSHRAFSWTPPPEQQSVQSAPQDDVADDDVTQNKLIGYTAQVTGGSVYHFVMNLIKR